MLPQSHWCWWLLGAPWGDVETLWYQPCHWQNGLRHVTHVKRYDDWLLLAVFHIHTFVAIDLDVFFRCCNQSRALPRVYLIRCVCWSKPWWAAAMCCCSTANHQFFCGARWLLMCRCCLLECWVEMAAMWRCGLCCSCPLGGGSASCFCCSALTCVWSSFHHCPSCFWVFLPVAGVGVACGFVEAVHGHFAASCYVALLATSAASLFWGSLSHRCRSSLGMCWDAWWPMLLV